MAEDAGPRGDDPHRARSRAGGELNAAVARRAVRIKHDVTGRGPTKSRAFSHDNVFVIVFEETQTRAEKSLIASGQTEAVLRTRDDLQMTMRPLLVEAVEELTSCNVMAFLSASHLVPDVSVEVFILDQPA